MKKLITVFILVLTFSISALAQSDNIKCSLVLNHSFTYNVPPVNYKITVTGEIPFSYTQNYATYIWFPTEEVLGIVSSISGSGTVILKAEGNMDLPDLNIEKLNYYSKIKIDIEGKTRYIKKPEAGGSIEVMNLKLNENWDGDIIWDIKTDDPEEDELRLKMLKMIVPTTFPDSPPTNKTLEYSAGYLYENQTFEQTNSIPGMGTFTWRYTKKYDFAKTYTEVPVENEKNPDPEKQHERSWRLVKRENNPNPTVNPKNEQHNYDDDHPKPKDYVKTHEPRIGPPLESIQWEIVDIETAPLRRKK